MIDDASQLSRELSTKRRHLPSHPKAVCPVVGTEQHLLGMVTHLACISSEDIVVDLGCGDGRMLVHAAQRCKCQCIGFDVRASCIEDTELAAAKAGVSHLVKAIECDMMEDKFELLPEWQSATIVYAYLLPDVTKRIAPMLRRAVDSGKIILLYCQSGSKIRRPNAPPPGNVIGDLLPMAQAVQGKLRLYAKPGVLSKRGVEELVHQPADAAVSFRLLSSINRPQAPPLNLPPMPYSGVKSEPTFAARLDTLLPVRQPDPLFRQRNLLAGQSGSSTMPSGHIRSVAEFSSLATSSSQTRLMASRRMVARARDELADLRVEAGSRAATAALMPRSRKNAPMGDDILASLSTQPPASPPLALPLGRLGLGRLGHGLASGDGSSPRARTGAALGQIPQLRAGNRAIEPLIPLSNMMLGGRPIQLT